MAAGKKESLFGGSDKKEGSKDGEASPMKRVEADHGSEEKKTSSGEKSDSNTGGGKGDGKSPSSKEAAPADMPTRHAKERRDMRTAHEHESRDMHGNHRDERRKMGERHEAQHVALNARQTAEEQAAQQAGMPAGAGPEMGTAGPSPNNVAPAGAGGGGI